MPIAHPIFFQDFAAILPYLQLSPPLQLYLGSVLLLLIGLVYEVRARCVRLDFLDDVSLQAVERTHPYLPRLPVIITIFFCSTALLVVALQTLTGLAPFDKPDEWIALGAFFIVTGALGMLAETQWRGAGQDACACIIGTAFAFLVLVLRLNLEIPEQRWTGVFLSVLLLCSITLAWRLLARAWTIRVRLIALACFLFWLAFPLFL